MQVKQIARLLPSAVGAASGHGSQFPVIKAWYFLGSHDKLSVSELLLNHWKDREVGVLHERNFQSLSFVNHISVELIRLSRVIHDVLRFEGDARVLERDSDFCRLESVRQEEVEVVGDPMFEPATCERRSSAQFRYAKLGVAHGQQSGKHRLLQ